jgi:hypothetical protein
MAALGVAPSSPRSRKIPRHSVHWSTITPLRSYRRISPWHFGHVMRRG